MENSDILAQPIRNDQKPAVVYVASRAPASRRVIENDLNRIVAMLFPDADDLHWSQFDWSRLERQHTQAIRAKLQTVVSERTGKPYSPATINRMLSTLRGVLKESWLLGHISAETYHRAVAIENVRDETLPAGRDIQSNELAALLETCDDKAEGVRDAAMISVLYACGLRRAEIVALSVEDFDGEMFKVLGKRNKQRFVPCGAAKPALLDWLDLRGSQPGALFWGLGNRNRGNRLTTQAVYNMLKRRAKVAGIEALSPHDFRRTFVGDLLTAGADIATVQKMAGHANVNTTARYDRRGDEAMKNAGDLLTLPTRKRR